MTAELLRLAERCEKETAGSRELDGLIMAALFRREERHIGCQEEQDDGSWQPVKDWVWVDPVTDRWVGTGACEFTSSLDAAMSLVPKGFWLDIETGTQKHAPDFHWPVVTIGSQSGEVALWRGQAITLAITVCAAALKARAASRDDEREDA